MSYTSSKNGNGIYESELIHAGLFEGIGGFSLGAQLAGIETVWISELSNYKQNILSQHFPNAKIYGKIQNIKNAPYADILTGGFPCQDISISGTRSGIIGTRSSLWEEFFRVAKETQPKYIVIENSPQLLNAGLEYILHDLSQIGYNAEWKIISAAQFGHRHLRKRFILIAYSNKIRFKRSLSIFRIIPEVFQQTKISKQTYLPMLLKRFDRYTNKRDLRTNTRFSVGLDKNTIESIGDSINVDLAQYIFECIKIHHAAQK